MKLIVNKVFLMGFVFVQFHIEQSLIASSVAADSQVISNWVQDHGDYIVEQLKMQGITDPSAIDFDAIVRASGNQVQLQTGGAAGIGGGSVPANISQGKGSGSKKTSGNTPDYLDHIKKFDKSGLKKVTQPKKSPSVEESAKTPKVSPLGKFAKTAPKNPLAKAKGVSYDSDSEDEWNEVPQSTKKLPKQQFGAKVGKAKIAKDADEDANGSQPSQPANTAPVQKPSTADSETSQPKGQPASMKLLLLYKRFGMQGGKYSKDEAERYVKLYHEVNGKVSASFQQKVTSRFNDLKNWLENGDASQPYTDDWDD